LYNSEIRSYPLLRRSRWSLDGEEIQAHLLFVLFVRNVQGIRCNKTAAKSRLIVKRLSSCRKRWIATSWVLPRSHSRERDANSVRFSRIKKLHLVGSRNGAAPRMPNEHKSKKA
jgi:hypothetical protein